MESNSKTKAGGSEATEARSECCPSKSKSPTGKAIASGSRTQLRPKECLNKQKNPAGQERAKHDDLLITLREAVLEVFKDCDWAKQDDDFPEFPPGFEKPVYGPQVLQAIEAEKTSPAVAGLNETKRASSPSSSDGIELLIGGFFKLRRDSQ